MMEVARPSRLSQVHFFYPGRSSSFSTLTGEMVHLKHAQPNTGHAVLVTELVN